MLQHEHLRCSIHSIFNYCITSITVETKQKERTFIRWTVFISENTFSCSPGISCFCTLTTLNFFYIWSTELFIWIMKNFVFERRFLKFIVWLLLPFPICWITYQFDVVFFAGIILIDFKYFKGLRLHRASNVLMVDINCRCNFTRLSYSRLQLVTSTIEGFLCICFYIWWKTIHQKVFVRHILKI